MKGKVLLIVLISSMSNIYAKSENVVKAELNFYYAGGFILTIGGLLFLYNYMSIKSGIAKAYSEGSVEGTIRAKELEKAKEAIWGFSFKYGLLILAILTISQIKLG